MINPEKRKAIFALHQSGMSIKEICRRLKTSRNAVRSIIKNGAAVPDSERSDKIGIDPELLSKTYSECEGWGQRVYEELTEKEGLDVGYSTVIRKLRELGLGDSKGGRCSQVPDQPGEEMQHDTTLYCLKIADKRTRLIASILYFRYSKVRYLKFYRCFNRFKMQCFFHEALTHFGYCARRCIIDNTNLARLVGSGTGANAIIHPEMEEFSGRYGFQFICHQVNHPNRKAGNERSFRTSQTNLFPGRKFESLQDLNEQAFRWATIRFANRPVSKTKLIPAKAFEHEQHYLIKLPSFVEPPYLVHQRGTDQYGYAAFDGNYYWVPGKSRKDVKILQYAGSIKIYCKRQLLAEYSLPPDEIKNERFSPEGMPPPAHQPSNRKKPTDQQEKKLRSMAEEVDAYLSFAIKAGGKQKHRFIRQLFSLSCKIAPRIFIAALSRALKFRITEIETIERICLLSLRATSQEIAFSGEIGKDIENRQAYQEGLLSEEVDLTVYDKLLEEDQEDNDG